MQAGLEYGTLWYRAVEVLLGDVGWGQPVDIWAAACVWCEMLRYKPLFREVSQMTMLIAVLRMLGSPQGNTAGYIAALPLWSCQFPCFTVGQIGDIMGTSLGEDHIPVLKGMLHMHPAHRLDATVALKHFENGFVNAVGSAAASVDGLPEDTAVSSCRSPLAKVAVSGLPLPTGKRKVPKSGPETIGDVGSSFRTPPAKIHKTSAVHQCWYTLGVVVCNMNY